MMAEQLFYKNFAFKQTQEFVPEVSNGDSSSFKGLEGIVKEEPVMDYEREEFDSFNIHSSLSGLPKDKNDNSSSLMHIKEEPVMTIKTEKFDLYDINPVFSGLQKDENDNSSSLVHIKEEPVMTIKTEEVDLYGIKPVFSGLQKDENDNSSSSVHIKEEPVTTIKTEEVDLYDIQPIYFENQYFGCHHCEEEFFTYKEMKRHIRKKHKLSNVGLPSVKNNNFILNFEDLSSCIIKKEVDICDILPDYKQQFVCYHCGGAFTLLKLLKRHITKKHQSLLTGKCQNFFTCYHCQMGFPSMRLIELHIIRKHFYDLFGRSGFDMKIKKKNKGSQGRIKKRKSKKRGTAKRNNDLIPQHIQSMFQYFSVYQPPKGRKELMCDECDWKSRSSELLIKHLKTVHNRHKPFECPKCEHSSLRISDLKRHFVSKHTNEKSFTCSFCSYTTSRSSTLYRHYRAYHSSQTLDVSLYQCPHCPYSSTRRDHLKSHTQYSHHSGSPVDCSHLGCFSETTIRHNAILHECPHCETRTFSLKYLRLHLRKHREPKLTSKKTMHLCPFCDHKGLHLPTLRAHIRIKHTGERPYACSHCPSRYPLNKILKRHLRKKHNFA